MDKIRYCRGAKLAPSDRLGLLKIFKKLITFPGLENCRLILMGKPLLPNMREFVNQNNLSAQVIELGTAFGQDGTTPVIYPSMFKFISSEGMGKDAILPLQTKKVLVLLN